MVSWANLVRPGRSALGVSAIFITAYLPDEPGLDSKNPWHIETLKADLDAVAASSPSPTPSGRPPRTATARAGSSVGTAHPRATGRRRERASSAVLSIGASPTTTWTPSSPGLSGRPGTGAPRLAAGCPSTSTDAPAKPMPNRSESMACPRSTATTPPWPPWLTSWSVSLPARSAPITPRPLSGLSPRVAASLERAAGRWRSTTTATPNPQKQRSCRTPRE